MDKVFCPYCCKYLFSRSYLYHLKTDYHKSNELNLGLDNLFYEPPEDMEIRTFCKRTEKVQEKNFDMTKPSIIEDIKKIRLIYSMTPGLSYNKISKRIGCGSSLTQQIIEQIQKEEEKQGFTRDSLGMKIYFKDMNYHRNPDGSKIVYDMVTIENYRTATQANNNHL